MKIALVFLFFGVAVVFRPAGMDVAALRPPIFLADSLDAETGLKVAPGLPLVKIHCTGCHSTKLITQFSATRQGWLDRIRWMQATQKLWDLGESEPPILDYLAKNYPLVERVERRPPLKDIRWYRF
ncbi:MAG: hypothetical protein LH606_21210 [Cytophagaceae bacterium]|nr:hypothetical protein [Cytophagaceae bacterium]